MSYMKSARAIPDLDSGLILATVAIAAEPDKVFKALYSQAIFDWWSAADGCRVTGWSADPVLGGRWKSVCKGRDGREVELGGAFLEIDPPRKLVQSWKFGRDKGPSTTLSYRLQALEGGTQVTVTHSGFSDPKSCRDHADRWERVLGWLADHLDPKGRGVMFVSKLFGPRPTFPADMTEAERQVMAEHIAFWTPHVMNGSVIIFGPLSDPNGPYGLGVIRAADRGSLEVLLNEDPAIKSGLGFRYETAPMLASRL